MTKNEFRIDLAGNPSVASIFSGKKPGQKCEFEVRATVKQITPDEAILSIDKLTYGHEEARPEGDAPMMMKMSPARKRED